MLSILPSTKLLLIRFQSPTLKSYKHFLITDVFLNSIQNFLLLKLLKTTNEQKRYSKAIPIIYSESKSSIVLYASVTKF